MIPDSSSLDFPNHSADRRARWLLLGLFSLASIFAGITKGTYDSGDSFSHYLLAHYAFQHPLNLLDAWGKPVFTLLAAVPAQGGWLGMKLFQCSVVALSAWCAYLVARALRFPWPELAILFCYAAPGYFLIQFSGLTEPLFGLVLVGAVALVMTGRPGWSAALLSWLPLVRSEGVVLLGIWVVYLVWRQQWRYLPLLGLGYVVYSLVGAMVLGEPGWIIEHNPYATISAYGHGSWGHFLLNIPNLLGWVLTVLFGLGGVRMLRDCTRPARWQAPLFKAELLLVYGSITAFIAAHTIFWAVGLFNSAGLARVLAVTTPLVAVVALNGLDGLAEWASSEPARRRIRIGATVAVVAWLFTGARTAFRWQRDFGLAPDQELAQRATQWLNQHYTGQQPRTAFEAPALAMALQADRADTQLHPHLVLDWQPALEQVPVNTLVFWDDVYAGSEGRIPLAQLLHDPRFKLLWRDSLVRNPTHPSSDSCQLAIFERVP
jgi:hypothetical protein